VSEKKPERSISHHYTRDKKNTTERRPDYD
jgi:hypothetical protein